MMVLKQNASCIKLNIEDVNTDKCNHWVMEMEESERPM